MSAWWRLMRPLAAMLVAGLGACASTEWRTDDPDARLDAVMADWQRAVSSGGCRQQQAASPGVVDCDGIAIELRRLAAAFPNRPRVLYANGLVAWEEGYPSRAIAWLDALLARDPAHVEGVVLRARLALDEGNLPFARRLLEDAIALVPDSALLHETLASVAYLERDEDAAARELRLALALGAPPWRINYHFGLLAEARGDLNDASGFYARALDENGAFGPARTRRAAIAARLAGGEQSD